MKSRIYVILFLMLLFGIENGQAQVNPYAPNAFQYVFIDGGARHTVALQCDGTIRTWGDNSQGQLGVSGVAESDVPVDPGIDEVIAVAAGGQFTMVLRDDGTVWTSGINGVGQLGDGTTNGRDEFEPVQDNLGNIIDDAISIAAGRSHALMIRADGSVWAWGDNGQGQLGDGTADNQLNPVPTTVTSNAIDLAGGLEHSLVLLDNGAVMSAGFNQFGQLGQGGTGGFETTFDFVENLDGSGDLCIGIAGGARHSMFVLDDGEVRVTGNNTEFQLTSSFAGTNTGSPFTIPGITDGIAVAAGGFHCLVMQADSTVVAWGRNDEGQCAQPAGANVEEPTEITNFDDTVVAICAGVGLTTNLGTATSGFHSGALLANGEMQTFGLNGSGQLGDGDAPVNKDFPVTVVDYGLGVLYANAGPDVFKCSGDVEQLGAPGDLVQFDYEWTPTTGLNDPNLPDPEVSLTTENTLVVDYVVIQTYASGFTLPACIVPDTAVVTVFGETIADFDHNGPRCEGEPVDFLNTGTSGSGVDLEWDFGPDATPQTSTDNNPTGIIFSSPGLKSVTLTVDNPGCGETDVITKGVLIHEMPTASFTTTAPVCQDEAVDFENSGTSGNNWVYSWDFGAGANPSTSTTENPEGVSYQSAGTKTVTFTITDGNGNCSNTDTETISINPTPTADFEISATTICTDTEIDFIFTGESVNPLTYSWEFGTNANPLISSNENPGGVSYNTSGNKQISLNITDGTCSDQTNRSIVVHERPEADFTSTAPACIGETVDFMNTGTTGENWVYSWDFGANASPEQSTGENPEGITYLNNGDKVITFTITDGNGNCSSTATDTISVLSTPVADFVTPDLACSQSELDYTFTGSSDEPLTYNWNFGVDADPATSADESPTGVSYSSHGDKLIFLQITNGVCGDSILKTLNVKQTPDVNIANDAPVCPSEQVTFSYTGTTGSQWSFFWDFGADATPGSSTAQSPSQVTYASGGSKLATLSVTNGQCTANDTLTFAIHDNPEAFAGLDTTICADASIQLGSTPLDDHSYQWFPPTTLDDPTIANPTASPIAAINEYEVLVTDDNTGCQNSDDVTVYMLVSGLADAGPDAEICFGDTVRLGKGLIEGQEYFWTPEDGILEQNVPNPLVSPEETTTYTLHVTYYGCDTITDNARVTVNPLPNASAGSDVTIVRGERTRLEGSGGVMFEWSPEEDINNSAIQSPTVYPEETTIYTVWVTNVFGCMDSDSVTVTVNEPTLFIPTAFTPNNSGRNDIFRVRGPQMDNFEMHIFNRWGERIFITNDFYSGWDGVSQITGDKAPQGAYPYLIRGVNESGEEVEFKGLVNLLR